MIIQTQKEREVLTEIGACLGLVLRKVVETSAPGITTQTLDSMAQDQITTCGYTPAFLNYKSEPGAILFPASLCTSVNEELVHGVPSSRILQEGDILKVDCAIKHKELFVDAAITVGIGEISTSDNNLINATRRALQSALVVARAGNRVSDIGAAVEQAVRSRGFLPIPELGGHGIGYHLHEDPFVPNIEADAFDDVLEEGQVIAIEPVVVMGDSQQIIKSEDGFAYISLSGEKGAHFEHTIIINKDRAPTILTVQP